MPKVISPPPAEHDYVHWAGLFLTVFANAISIVGVVWLLLRLGKLPQQARKRLFPQQIRALAASDLVFHLASTVVCIDSFGGLSGRPELGQPVCQWSENFVRFGTNLTLLLELNIAMGFAFQSFRFVRALRTLPTLIYISAPVALLITVLEAISYQVEQDPYGWCKLAKSDLFATVLFLFVFLMSVLAYLLAACKARGCSQAVEARCWKRAAAYPLSFLITQVGILYVIFEAPDDPKHDTSVTAALTLQNLTGFANTLTYALQSRYAAKMQQADLAVDTGAERTNFLSFEARFGGVMVEEILPVSEIASSNKPSQDSSGLEGASGSDESVRQSNY